MLADRDGPESSSIGALRSLSNGSRSGDGHPAGTATSNGSHKLVSNGSSLQNEKEEEKGEGGKEAEEGSRGGTGSRQSPGDFFGHNREEVTRILIQALSDMGYHAAAQSVSAESGYELESGTVAAFRTAVLQGAWQPAEELLSGAVIDGAEDVETGNGLLLTPETDRNLMRIWIRQQKFLELLERKETSRALVVLRTELTPLCQDKHGKVEFLSSLLMCQSPCDLKDKAEWDGAHGKSRLLLLSDLSRCISPSVMLPEHRLSVLLHQVKESQISNCLYHTRADSPTLYSDHICDRSDFPSEIVKELGFHGKEVWQVKFSPSGSMLAVCGEDPAVDLYHVPSFELHRRLPGHGDNGHDGGAGNIAWSPDESLLLSCGRDHYGRLWATDSGTMVRTLPRFSEPVTSCVWAPDGRTFVTGSLDKGKTLCQWNLNGDLLYNLPNPDDARMEDLALSPDGRWLAAMDYKQRVFVYNFLTKTLKYVKSFKVRATSVFISQNSQYLLVNKSDGEISMIELESNRVVQKYGGAVGGQYAIRAVLGGANESFVISGSEDGQVCIWHKISGILLLKLEAHQISCNSVDWNPSDPYTFVSCGDDHRVKVWSKKNRFRSGSPSQRRPCRSSRGSIAQGLNGHGRNAGANEAHEQTK